MQVQFLGWEDPWRRAWQPTPVLLPGKFHGQRSLAGYSPRGCKECSDMTEHAREGWGGQGWGRVGAGPSKLYFVAKAA